MKLVDISHDIDDKHPFVATGFNDTGLLVFQGGLFKLHLDCLRTSEDIHFSKSISLEPCPALPRDAGVYSIIVSPGGSRVAVVGKKGCWVLRVNSQLWAQSSAHVQLWSPLLQSHYFCESTPVMLSQWVCRKGSEAVVKWLPSSSSSLVRSQLLSVLTDDTVIRIFNIDEDTEAPIYRLDLGPYISASSSESVPGKTNTYGLLNRIVSYCFYPTGAASLYILAIDSEGSLYGCEIDDHGATLAEPKALDSPSCLTCDAQDIVSLPHPLSSLFSVFIVLGSDGTLTHLVGIPIDGGHLDVFAHDQLIIPSRSGSALGAVSLSTNAKGAYVVSTTDGLHYISCTPWIFNYRESVEDSSKNAFLQSTIYELLSVSPSDENKENASICSKQSPAVVLSAREPSDGEMGDLFIQSTAELHAAFVRMQPLSIKSACHSIPPGSSSAATAFQKDVDSLLSTKTPIPQFVGTHTVKEDELLDRLHKVVDSRLLNLDIERKASQLCLARVLALYESQTHAQDEKNALDAQLASVMNSLSLSSSEMADVRERIVDIERRLDRMVSLACAGLPLSADEEKMLKMLKQYKRDIEQLSIELPRLSLDIQEEKRVLTGPTKSFTTSQNGRQRNAQRCIREVDCLVDRMNDLKERVDGMSLSDEK